MNYDLLASGLLLGGSSVALALTALSARRACRAARVTTWNANCVTADRRAVNATAAEVKADRDAAKTQAEHAMKAANAASLDRLFSPNVHQPAPERLRLRDCITVTPPETVDVIPIPVPKPKLYDGGGTEVEGVPGSRVYGADAGDVNVLEFPDLWRDHGEAGA